MISKEDRDIYIQALNVFGITAQILVSIEECGEFQHAAARLLNGRENNLLEKLVDVFIMMEQLIVIFDAEEFLAERKSKQFGRLIRKINSYEERK